MAGFNVKKAIAAEKTETITIPLVVNVTYDDSEAGSAQASKDSEAENISESVEPFTVKHIMRIPTMYEREKHQSMLVKIRGQNVKASGSATAWFWLWKQCIVKLEGYDDLPEVREQMIKLFEDSSLLHIHAENAAVALLNFITGSEGEISKK